jgi:hypothetical protein
MGASLSAISSKKVYLFQALGRLMVFHVPRHVPQLARGRGSTVDVSVELVCQTALHLQPQQAA